MIPMIPRFTPMPLARLSICPCGFSVLKDEIQVGTVYMVDLSSIRSGFTYGCGGCKKFQTNVIVIDAAHRTPNDPTIMPLPWGLFEPAALPAPTLLAPARGITRHARGKVKIDVLKVQQEIAAGTFDERDRKTLDAMLPGLYDQLAARTVPKPLDSEARKKGPGESTK
jgi:hypothetical protein